MNQKFKEGDPVKLKIGSPRLIVNMAVKVPDLELGNSFSGYYQCTWFEEGVMKMESFHQDALVSAE